MTRCFRIGRIGHLEARGPILRPVTEAEVGRRVEGGSSADIFRPSVGHFGMDGTLHLSGRHFRPGFGRTCHEIVVKLCRALSCRYPVDCIVVRPRRYGNVANRNRLRHSASQHHCRSAEAGGKATKARSGRKHSCISPDIANRSNAGACERFSNGEACRA